MSKFDILQNNKIGQEIANLDLITDISLKANLNIATQVFFMFRIPNFVLSLVRLTAIYFIGMQIIYHKMDYSMLIGISGTFFIFDNIILNFIFYFRNITRDFINIEKIWEIIDLPYKMKNYCVGNDFIYKKGSINIQDLSFNYNNTRAVFENFSLDISGGKKIAIVGKSGSGKTTLIKLLTGFLSPNSGTISIDEQNLADIAMIGYYKYIGYLSQEPNIFDGTVYENLTYGQKNILTKKQLDKIINMAECGFLYDLENGLQTEIGEKGIRLSGGQKQRLAIAKLMIKDPKIIILDEPTSALDSYSEEAITRAFQRLFADKTTIIIAHRLQTVKDADEILVMDQGKIIARGNHEELYSTCETYKQMVHLQSMSIE